MVGLDVQYWRSMNKINARHVDRPVLHLVKLGYAQTNGVVSVRRPCSEHSFLVAVCLGRSNFCLHWVVIMESHMEDEDEPDVAEFRESLETA
jgi:hypothetical protein